MTINTLNVVVVAREAGVEEHEVEAWATDARIAEVGYGCLPEADCQRVRDTVAYLVA